MKSEGHLSGKTNKQEKLGHVVSKRCNNHHDNTATNQAHKPDININ
jgi:hypothetical protein